MSDILASVEALKAKYGDSKLNIEPKTRVKEAGETREERATQRNELRQKRAAEMARIKAKARALRTQRDARLKAQGEAAAAAKSQSPSTHGATSPGTASPSPVAPSPSPDASASRGPLPTSTRLSCDELKDVLASTNSPSSLAPEDRSKKIEDMKRRLAARKAAREQRSSGVSAETAVATVPAETIESPEDVQRCQAKVAALQTLKEDLAAKRKALAAEKTTRERTNTQLDQLIKMARAKKAMGNRPALSISVAAALDTAEKPPPLPSKKIGSLGDMQAALQAKKARNEAKRKSRIVRRQKREATGTRKRTLTREERKLNRMSRIMKKEVRKVDKETNQMKINNQLGMLLQSMVQLEQAFMAQEKEKIELKHKLGMLEAERDMYQCKCESIHSTLRANVAEMDHLKTSMDRLCTKYPFVKTKGRGATLWNDLQERTATITQTRHKLHVATLKYAKDIKVAHEEQEKVVAERTEAMEKEMESHVRSPAASNFSDLLAQIRSGTTLKAVDPLENNTDKEKETGAWRKSIILVQSLQDTVKAAMDSRNLALSGLGYDSESSSGDDSDFSDEEWDDL